MKDTTAQGDIAEWQIVAALVRRGRKVLRPVSSASRYDVAIDNLDGTMTRVQCKMGRLRDGRIEFRLYSMSGHQGTRGRAYAGEVDAFGVYCPATRQSYLVPVSAIAGRTGSACLRVSPARNGQRTGIRGAAEFAIGS